MGLKSAFPWWALRFGCSSKKKAEAEDGEAGIDNMKTTGHTLDNSATNSSEGDVAGTTRAEVHVQRYGEKNCRPQPPSMQRQSSPLSVQDRICLTYKKAISEKNFSTPKLGILRLDYSYPPAVGDIDLDSPESFHYPVIYRVIPGLTFEMCQSGELSEEIKAKQSSIWRSKECLGLQLPSLCMCFDSDETIAIFTANSTTLLPVLPRLLEMCALRQEDKDRIQVVGCQDVDGFDAVEKGEAVDVLKVDAGIVALAKRVVAENPRIKAILLECTELPAYADSLKFATGLPVYDSISVCNSFMAGFLDNPKIGLNHFYEAWDGKQAEYTFGACLSENEQGKLKSAKAG